MARLWTWTTIVLSYSAVCYGMYLFQGQKDTESTPPVTPDNQFDIRSLMVQYIIHKGCDYVSAYVRSKYINHYYHNAGFDDRKRRFLYTAQSSAKCDWRDEVKRRCISAHVPAELTHALLDCGQDASLHAVGMREDVSCNSTTQQKGGHGPQAVAVGRSVKSRSDIFHNRALRKASQVNLGTGVTTANDSVTLVIPDGSGSSKNTSSHSASLTSGNREPPLNDRLKRWCAKYSRHVNRKFNLNDNSLVRTSAHWLLEVYTYAERFHTPRCYVHALVGCGQRYALSAFNVRPRTSSSQDDLKKSFS